MLRKAYIYLFILWGIIIFFSKLAGAYDFEVINLNELSLDYKNYSLLNPNSRNMLIYPDPPKESLNLTLKTDLFKLGYWDSTVESLTTSDQYRSVGLETRLGIRLTNNAEVGVYHHSQHDLDRAHSFMSAFPEEDAFELKIYLYRAKTREALF